MDCSQTDRYRRIRFGDAGQKLTRERLRSNAVGNGLGRNYCPVGALLATAAPAPALLAMSSRC